MYDIHASSENVFESLQMLRISLIQKQQAIFNTPNRGTEEAEAAIQIAVQGGRRLQLPRKKIQYQNMKKKTQEGSKHEDNRNGCE